jgi:hypothetical protein
MHNLLFMYIRLGTSRSDRQNPSELYEENTDNVLHEGIKSTNGKLKTEHNCKLEYKTITQPSSQNSL